MPTTFKVNDVTTNKKALQPANYQSVVQHRCGNVKPEAFSPPRGSVVGELRGLGRCIGIDNGLISAIHTAWSNHYPLVLTPDMLWLCIAQGLAQHINLDDNAEKLRHLFVEHEGKKTLKVRRDDFVKGSPHNPWPEVFEDFAQQVRRNVGDKTYSLLTPNFTTTGPVERAAAQVVMMNCFKQYFEYLIMYICGIPEITLEGTIEDWVALREKALHLVDYDLGWWVDALRPVLDQFVAAASGSVDQEFWRKIYHQYGGRSSYSPGPFVTGWILAFFPYMSGYEGTKRNPFMNLWQTKDPASHKVKGDFFARYESNSDGEEEPGDSPHAQDENKGLTHHQFPPGVVATPFTWVSLAGETPMHFYAGFMAVTQDPSSRAVRPEIGWAVADDVTLQETKQKQELSRSHRW